MAARFADFDAAFAERDVEPVVIRLFGRIWHLPGRLPAAAVLTVARYVADGRASGPMSELSSAEALGLARDLIPAEALDAWFAKGLDIEQLEPIVEWVFEQYRDEITEVAASGEAQAPTGAAPDPTSSSPGGGSSRPTSPASTSSPSPGPSGA